MKKRVVVGLLAGVLAIAGVLLLDGSWIQIVMAGLMTLGAFEIVRMAHQATKGSPLPILVPAVAVGALLPLLEFQHLEIALLSAPIAFGALVVLSRGPLASGLPALGWFSFSLPYLTLPVWAVAGIHARGGAVLLLAVLASVWVNDSAAYFAGSRFGRRLLAPSLSPKKTWEGSVTGAVLGTSTGAGMAAGLAGMPWLPMVGIFALTSVAAQIGDLMESLLKRAAGVKDSGTVMPGHGGVLDRMDAILFAAPLFYALATVFDLWTLKA